MLKLYVPQLSIMNRSEISSRKRGRVLEVHVPNDLNPRESLFALN